MVREFNAKFWFPSLKSFFNSFYHITVDITALIIKAIWHNFPVNPNSQVIPLRLFVEQTLKRSQTGWSTLLSALFYLMRIKPQIKILWHNPDSWSLNSKDDKGGDPDPATCGRRMFLASLILASKYLLDQNCANNTWSKKCGLPVQQINVIERRFLDLIDYKLFIGEDEYKIWIQNVWKLHRLLINNQIGKFYLINVVSF